MSSRHSPTVALLTAPLEIWLSCSGATSRSTILSRNPDPGDPARALGPFAGPLRWATLSAFHHDRLGPAFDRGCKGGAFFAFMPKKQEINLEKVLASLNTPCTKCGYSIPPNELQRDPVPEVRGAVCPSSKGHLGVMA